MDTGSGIGTYSAADPLNALASTIPLSPVGEGSAEAEEIGKREALLRLLRENERILSEIRRVFHRLQQARDYALTEGSDPEIGRALIENLRRRRVGLGQVLRANRLEMEQIMDSLSTRRQAGR